MRHSATLVIALLGALAIGSAAQASDPPVVRWQWDVPEADSILTDKAGNVYVAGGWAEVDPFLIKFDRAGNKVWTRWFPEAVYGTATVEGVNQHGIWVVAYSTFPGVRLVSHDGLSVKAFDGTNLLDWDHWGRSFGFDSQGRMWIGPNQYPQFSTEARVGCFGPNGLEWISTPLGHNVSALYQWAMVGDTLYGVYSTGPDSYGPFRLFKLDFGGLATSYAMNVGTANNVGQSRFDFYLARVPTPDGNLLFDFHQIYTSPQKHYLTKVTPTGQVLWMREVPQPYMYGTWWSIVAPSGKIWVPTHKNTSHVNFYDQASNFLGVTPSFTGGTRVLRLEPGVPQEHAVVTTRYVPYEAYVHVMKLGPTTMQWDVVLPNSVIVSDQVFGADNDIIVLTEFPKPDGNLSRRVTCLAQTPEPVPDAPAQVSFGPQAYRTQSVLDNDRYTQFGASTVATNPSKGNLWLRPDGTFLYSPWAGTQNTTDSFQYYPLNGGAKGPATTVTVKVGAVPYGEVTALKPSVGAILGGKTLDGRVELESPAPAGGMAVALVSRNATALRVPDVVVVPAGRRSASFTLTPIPVAAETTVEFFAERTSSRVTASLTVRPPQLDSLAAADTSLSGTETLTATVKLTGKAPKGGSLVSLRSTNPKVKVPESVRVPEGFGTARFKIRLLGVSAPGTARVVASFGSRTRAVDLTLSP